MGLTQSTRSRQFNRGVSNAIYGERARHGRVYQKYVLWRTQLRQVRRDVSRFRRFIRLAHSPASISNTRSRFTGLLGNGATRVSSYTVEWTLCVTQSPCRACIASTSGFLFESASRRSSSARHGRRRARRVRAFHRGRRGATLTQVAFSTPPSREPITFLSAGVQ